MSGRLAVVGLGPGDGRLDQLAAEAALRGGQPGIGEQQVGTRDPAPGGVLAASLVLGASLIPGEIIHGRDHTLDSVRLPLWPVVIS